MREPRGCPKCGDKFTNVKEISGKLWGWHWCESESDGVHAIAWDEYLQFDICDLILPQSPFDDIV